MSTFSFNMFWQASARAYNKNNLFETSGCWSRDLFNFYFFKKGLRLVSSLTFCWCTMVECTLNRIMMEDWWICFLYYVCSYDLLQNIVCQNIVCMIYILLTDQISLSDCLCFLKYLAICHPVRDVMNFEIYFSFFIKPFFYTT